MLLPLDYSRAVAQVKVSNNHTWASQLTTGITNSKELQGEIVDAKHGSVRTLLIAVAKAGASLVTQGNVT